MSNIVHMITSREIKWALLFLNLDFDSKTYNDNLHDLQLLCEKDNFISHSSSQIFTWS